MTDIQRLHVGPRLSEASIHRGTIYLAGQVPNDTSADIEGQTREVLGMVDQLLAEAGSSKQRILMAQIYLADLQDFRHEHRLGRMGAPRACATPRATVQANLANPDWRIEIIVTAAVDPGT